MECGWYLCSEVLSFKLFSLQELQRHSLQESILSISSGFSFPDLKLYEWTDPFPVADGSRVGGGVLTLVRSEPSHIVMTPSQLSKTQFDLSVLSKPIHYNF